jgi:hypothetical protein
MQQFKVCCGNGAGTHLPGKDGLEFNDAQARDEPERLRVLEQRFDTSGADFRVEAFPQGT